MKILALSHLFPHPGNPTLGLFVWERLRHMAAQAEVTVVVPVKFSLFQNLKRNNNSVQMPPGHEALNVIYVPFVSVPFLHALTAYIVALCVILNPRARRALRCADLIDAHWTHPEARAAGLLGRLFALPYCVTLRGKEAFYPDDGALRERQIAAALSGAAGVVALSEELAQCCRTVCHHHGPIEVIPNGVDVARFKPGEQSDSRLRHGVQPDKFVVLSVGFLSPRKGFHHLIAAWPEVLKHHPNAALVIVGDEGAEGSREYTHSLQRQIAELGLGDAVRLAGRAAGEELVHWYRAADLFVLATAGEGSPNVVLEALACGLPCVVNDVGGVREILCEPHLGRVVTADNAHWPQHIDAAIASQWQRPRIRATMEQRGWPQCAERALKFLNALLG